MAFVCVIIKPLSMLTTKKNNIKNTHTHTPVNLFPYKYKKKMISRKILFAGYEVYRIAFSYTAFIYYIFRNWFFFHFIVMPKKHCLGPSINLSSQLFDKYKVNINIAPFVGSVGSHHRIFVYLLKCFWCVWNLTLNFFFRIYVKVLTFEPILLWTEDNHFNGD